MRHFHRFMRHPLTQLAIAAYMLGLAWWLNSWPLGFLAGILFAAAINEGVDYFASKREGQS